MLRAAADAMFTMADTILKTTESVWDALSSAIQSLMDLATAAPRSAFLDEQVRQATGATQWDNWRMVPDTIEISGEFTNLPDGVSSADLARWSADGLAGQVEQGLTDKLQDIGTSFYAMRTEPYYAGTVIAADTAEPSITVRCQYCGVGGQDPEGGVCGRCGGPFPPAPMLMVPRRLGSSGAPESKPIPPFTLFLDREKDADGQVISARVLTERGEIELTRDAEGQVIGAHVVHPGTYRVGRSVK